MWFLDDNTHFGVNNHGTNGPTFTITNCVYICLFQINGVKNNSTE